MGNKLTVSVIMITYGHENYIEQAILGVLMQEGNFEMELVIANDCSPDATDTIVKKIIKTHPKADKIKYLKREKNLGVMPNFIDASSHCSGQYIALCEGDDYWIDPHKTEKQLNVFLSDEAIGLVHTGLKYYHQQNDTFSNDVLQSVSNQNEVVPSLLKAKYIDFCTVMIKTDVFNNALKILNSELLNNAIIGDTRIILECAFHSKVGFVNECTTVYRVLQNSASHPTQIDKLIATTKDTYNCRKQFISRNGLNKKWLGVALCNYNQSLINKAYEQKKYQQVIKLISNIIIKDYFHYCDFKTFIKKTHPKLIVKLILSIFGFRAIINSFK